MLRRASGQWVGTIKQLSFLDRLSSQSTWCRETLLSAFSSSSLPGQPKEIKISRQFPPHCETFTFLLQNCIYAGKVCLKRFARPFQTTCYKNFILYYHVYTFACGIICLSNSWTAGVDGGGRNKFTKASAGSSTLTRPKSLRLTSDKGLKAAQEEKDELSGDLFWGTVFLLLSLLSIY